MGNGCWSRGSFLMAVTVATFDFNSTVIVHWSFDDVAPRSLKPDLTRALKQWKKHKLKNKQKIHIKWCSFKQENDCRGKARRRRVARGLLFLEIGNRDSSFVVDTNRVFSSSFFQKEKIGTAWLTSVKIVASMYQNRDKKGLNIDPERVGLVCYAYAQRFTLVFLGGKFRNFLKKGCKSWTVIVRDYAVFIYESFSYKKKGLLWKKCDNLRIIKKRNPEWMSNFNIFLSKMNFIIENFHL